MPASPLPILLLCLFWSVSLPAQAPKVQNPRTSPADIAAGARTYRAQCSICHGLDGSGADGPDLTPLGFLQRLSDADLFRIISLGIPGTLMYPNRLVRSPRVADGSVCPNPEPHGETGQTSR